jgi:hypothetical protein
MNYEHKLNKYKYKLLSTKNQLGGKDCDFRHAEDILSSTYIKDISNFIPFEKSILHPFRKHPVCSYSIWDKDHIQLYVPTPPNLKDKLFPAYKYFIRIHKVYFKSQDDPNEEGVDSHMIMWSPVHEKWYEVENWPHNDNILEELLVFLNTDSVIGAKMVINNLFLFRKEPNNPALQANVRQILEFVTDDQSGRTASSELLDELESYDMYNGDHEEVVGDEFNEESY